jgi:hypothetical protein
MVVFWLDKVAQSYNLNYLEEEEIRSGGLRPVERGVGVNETPS